MTSTSAVFRWASFACAVATLTALPARAETFALGTVSAPGTFSYDVIEHRTPTFEDVFTFSVASGASLVFTAFLNTPMSNRFWISDLDGRLESGGTSIVEGDSVEIPYPFPRTEVTFAPRVLGEGNYAVRTFGSPFSAYQGTYGSYDATFTFAGIAAPVPEPATALMLAVGLVGIGAAARRSRRG